VPYKGDKYLVVDDYFSKLKEVIHVDDLRTYHLTKQFKKKISRFGIR
jgi:hypothetical protein